MPYMDELTVFINVKIDNLNEFSKEIPEKVRKELKRNIEIININTDKKYLSISTFWKFIFSKKLLFRKIFLGLTWDIRLLNENLNKA